MSVRTDLPALELERQRASARARLFGESAFPIVGDRYAIRARLGSGAMGIVYRAHDRLLDRDVALKLVRPAGIDRRDAIRRARREARSLARLHHPNVVEVFDVGTSEHGLHIAMELVRGRDLQRWAKQTDASWRQRLQACIAAGRGLAAAHAVGIVHRDFKPSNVIVSDDGRVLVLDFGLAKAMHAYEHTLPSTLPSPRTGASTLGSLVGTPRYMAPEQHAGAPVDPRTDQFSYCATVHELLVGAPAFTAKSLPELEAQKRAHAIASGSSTVPRAVLSALARGMDPDPERRWPSMDDLLAVLQRAMQRRLARRVLAAVATAASVLALAVTTRPTSGDDPPTLAAAAPHEDPAALQAVAATEHALAGAATQRSSGAYREGLDGALALRNDAETTGHASLQAEVALEIARGHWRLGDYARAETALRDALALALGAGDLDVAARAAAGELLVVGYLQGRTDEALRLSERAIGLARASSDADAFESTARTHLGRVLLRRGELAAAEAEQRRALELHVRARGPGHPGEAPLRDALAEVLVARGDPQRAAREQSIALRLREQSLGPWHPAVASSHHALGVTASDRQEAIDHLQRALAIRTRGLGADHVRTVAVAADLGAALLAAGRVEDARPHVDAALAGAIAPGEAEPFVRLGYALEAAGEPDSARAIMKRVLGQRDDNPRVASSAFANAEAWLRDNPE